MAGGRWLQSGGRWLTAAFDCAALDEWSVRSRGPYSGPYIRSRLWRKEPNSYRPVRNQDPSDFLGRSMGAAKRARPARRRRGRACRIRSVDLTIRKRQREERTTTIANKYAHALDLAKSWLRPCLFQPPQLCVRGKLATGLCQTSSNIFTLAL